MENLLFKFLWKFSYTNNMFMAVIYKTNKGILVETNRPDFDPELLARFRDVPNGNVREW